MDAPEHHPIPEDLEDAIESGRYTAKELENILSVLHPVDLAGLLEDLDVEDRLAFFKRLDDERAAEVLAGMSINAQRDMAPLLPEEQLADIIENLDADVVADILPAVPAQEANRLLDQVDDEEHREDIRALRAYPDHTAGGIMNPDFVEVREKATCGEALGEIQGNLDAESIDYVYILDENKRLLGVCSIRTILMSKPDQPIQDVMTREPLVFAGHSLDQEDVARLVQKYDLKAVPVIDNSFRMLGIVTFDDVIDVIQQEASEDLLKMAGAGHMHPLHDSVMKRFRVRLPWLAATVLIQLAIAWTIRGYEGILQKFWLLAAFFPIIMAIGGNVGLQSATLVVRGLATGELTLNRSARVLWSEMRVGFLIGIACGFISGGMAYLMHLEGTGAFNFGITVAVSMLAGITFAALFGTAIPFLCERIDVDPAVASGPFITTLNDILSILIYLSLATYLIAS